MKKRPDILKTTNLLIVITAVTKIFGFLREMVLANCYGASNISDAFLLSQNLPITIFGLFTMALATSFIPIYNSVYIQFGSARSNLFMSNLINVVFCFCSIIVFTCFIFAKNIIQIMASGFSNGTLEIATCMFKITIFSIYFIALFTIVKGYLQINENYIIVVLGGLLLDVIMITAIFISYNTSYNILALGLLISYALQFLLLIPSTIKTGYRHKKIFNLNSPEIKKIIIMAWPVMIGTTANDCNVVIDNLLASHTFIGGISILNYSSKINSIAQGIFVTTSVMVFFPKISKLYENNKQIEIWKWTEKTIQDVMQYIIPIMLGTIAYSEPIIKLLFQRGKFDQAATKTTSEVLLCYSVGLIAVALREIFSKIFYAMHESKIPMRNGIITIIINIALNFVFINILGLSGLALATSISVWISVILLVRKLYKKNGFKFSYKLAACLSIQFITALIAVGTSLIIYDFFTQFIDCLLIELVVVVLYASAVYFSLLIYLKRFLSLD